MAFIGMRHPVVAKIKSHTPGSEPVYENGMVMGHAVTGNLTINRNNNPLYGDDVIVEDDNSVSSMQIEMGTDDLLENVESYALGLTEKTVGEGQTAATEYIETDASAPHVGTGYIRVRKKDGIIKYQGVWMYKVMYSKNSENSQTKGENITWQTPTLQGRAAGVDIDGSGKLAFRKKRYFDTYDAAEAWLDALADISA
jgi:hypothetical protein